MTEIIDRYTQLQNKLEDQKGQINQSIIKTCIKLSNLYTEVMGAVPPAGGLGLINLLQQQDLTVKQKEELWNCREEFEDATDRFYRLYKLDHELEDWSNAFETMSEIKEGKPLAVKFFDDFLQLSVTTMKIIEEQAKIYNTKVDKMDENAQKELIKLEIDIAERSFTAQEKDNFESGFLDTKDRSEREAIDEMRRILFNIAKETATIAAATITRFQTKYESDEFLNDAKLMQKIAACKFER